MIVLILLCSLIELVEGIRRENLLVLALVQPEVHYLRNVELELRVLAVDLCAAFVDVLRVQELRHVEVVVLEYLIEAVLCSQSNSWLG